MIVTLACWLARGAGAPKGNRFHLFVLCLLLAVLGTWGQCPFEIWPDLGPCPIERMAMIVLVAWFLASGAGMPEGDRLRLCFLAFILALLASWIECPFPGCGDTTVDNYLKYAIFYVILVTSVRNAEDLYRILVGYVGRDGHFHAAQSPRVPVRPGFLRPGNRPPAGRRHDVRFQRFCRTDRLFHAVRLGPLAALAGLVQRAGILAYICLSGVCVVLTGSRMGFVGMVLAGLLATLASKHRWRMLALYPVLLAAVWTVLPPRKTGPIHDLARSQPRTEECHRFRGQFSLFRLRAGACRCLPSAPCCGFGPQSFGVATGKHVMPHNLYGQLLAELGLAGALAFAAIGWGVSRNAVEARRLARQPRHSQAGTPATCCRGTPFWRHRRPSCSC